MTNEEAKQRLEDFKPYLATDDWKDCYQVAIEALEKQIPTKPQLEKQALGRGFHSYECPACKYILDAYTAQNYCFHCGQAIDWSE